MSLREKFTGVGVALITPFNEDLSVDYDGLKKVLDGLEKHVDYLLINGTTSEASTLSTQEKNDILKFILEYNQGKLPVLYGIGANDTNKVLSLIEDTDFSGIDAILTVSPYYNKPSQAGIIAHYEAIADKSPVPVMLYNVPGRTGINMNAATTLTLAEHSNIFGIKEASGDLEQCMTILKHKPEDFMLISGDDMMTTSLISLGAEGVISVLANAFPDTFCKSIHAALAGDFKKATDYILNFVEINPLMYCESNPVGVKEVLFQNGIINAEVRLPLLKASNDLKNNIKAALLK